MSHHLLNKSEAMAIANTSPELISAINQLSSSGLKAPAIFEYAKAIAEGREPAALPVQGSPHVTVIQMHSFLRDENAWRYAYGLSPETVNELLDLEERDPDSAEAALREALGRSPYVHKNGKLFTITRDGSKGAVPSGTGPLVNASHRTAALKKIITQQSGLYGTYKFDAFGTDLGEARRFGVDLGRGLFALWQSKDGAVAVARIVSVNGRSHPSVADAVAYVSSSGQVLYGEAIPSDKWDGIRGSRESITPSPLKPGQKLPSKGEARPPSETQGSRRSETVQSPQGKNQ